MTARRGSGRDGFTLVETLVAFFVLATVMAVTVRGFVVARVGLERAQSTLAAEAVARSIVETELDRLVSRPGELTGSTDGVAWTVTAEPIDLPLPAPPPVAAGRRPSPAGGARDAGDVDGAAAEEPADRGPAARWTPLRVTVRVANGRGRPLAVETVHLVRVE